MKLATPATASEPYRADAPSSTSSIRCSMMAGVRLLTSTWDAELASMVCRCPFSKTSVDLGPRPRRSMLLVGVFQFSATFAEEICGMSRSTSIVETRWFARISAASMMATGCGRSAGREMYDPVTTISSSSLSCAKSAGDAVSNAAARLPISVRQQNYQKPLFHLVPPVRAFRAPMTIAPSSEVSAGLSTSIRRL